MSQNITKEYNNISKDFVEDMSIFKYDLLHGLIFLKGKVMNLKDAIIYDLRQDLNPCHSKLKTSKDALSHSRANATHLSNTAEELPRKSQIILTLFLVIS